jgi:enoyl-[acyl-carrier protein] reductase II
MSFSNTITQLFNIQYPILQAGMVWVSGWRLASAVSNAGAFGLIGSGSMYPEVLREHIRKCKAATDKPFGVNVPLFYKYTPQHIQVIIEEGVRIVFTSAGNPKTYTAMLQQHGITVVHVVGSSKFALKAEEAGCNAIVAEGFEAGGHNGREETTSIVLVPAVCKTVSIPVIAAGGIATGRQMLAAMVLGANGVQIGSRFAASVESSAHEAFKEAIVKAGEGDTMLMMKKIVPVRLLHNAFSDMIQQAEARGATAEELQQLLGKSRAMQGMFSGDLENGELEIGQVSALIDSILPAATIIKTIWNEFEFLLQQPLG